MRLIMQLKVQLQHWTSMSVKGRGLRRAETTKSSGALEGMFSEIQQRLSVHVPPS